MSTPALLFSCTRCEFTGSNTSLRGDWSYESDGRLFPIDRELGWCDDCGGFSPVENIPTPEKIEAQKMRRLKEEQELKEQIRAYRQLLPWHKRYSLTAVRLPDDLSSRKSVVDSGAREIKESIARLRFLDGRKSPARCLACGSTQIAPTQLPAVPFIDKRWDPHLPEPEPIPTGFQHPGCGGDITARYSTVWLSVRMYHNVFDTEGICLRETDIASIFEAAKQSLPGF